ncbi:hypothetical protein ACIP79_00405 [Streptomyces sp. NPDC088747]|uniref:hypothetical protein n=1 Tax=Streptomyces sp. NPDC088747 TaxID=3365886 RepID=UPI003800E5E7
MPRQPATFRIDPGSEFSRVAAALREIDEDLPGQLRDELRDAVKPLVREAQRKAQQIPAHGRAHTGLRTRVAKGVRAHVFVGRKPGVEIVSTMPDKSERNLPAYLDNPGAGWRHPVFGNRHEWVSQHTGAPWFRETFAQGDDDIEGRLDYVMNRAAETIAAAGRG